MAKFQVNTKSKNYSKDKEAFLRELKQFNESKNIPYKIPTVNGIDIDLYLFYSLVQQRGGLSKVNHSDAWDSFLRPLRLPHPCINGSTLLRKVYGIYLEKYEKAKGPPSRDDDNDMDDDPRRGRGGMPRVTYSGTYISGEQLRTSKAIAGPSERLALSLISPFPNEQDFALNICTILAADFSNRLPLSTTPHILDFLLAHAGVYNHSSLRDTIGRSYYEARGKYPDEFWSLRAGGGGARELADETKFMVLSLEQPDLMVQALAAQNNLTDRLTQDEDDPNLDKIVEEDIIEDWVVEPSEEDQLFAPELPGGSTCVYTQRIKQIASIVRSLSFHEENVQLLAKNTTLLRFLLLCSNCWVGTLRQSGLDTLGNIATELVIKDPATCLISRHVLSTIQSALVSNDRARVLAALEMLNKLSQNEANEDVLLKVIEPKVYSDVCSLLTLRDIMLLVCTLECVCAVTSLGERACECVARVPGVMHTLVSLVTVEAQSYGPKACILMRVVETVSGATTDQQQTQQQQQPQPQQPQQQQAQPQTPVKLQTERTQASTPVNQQQQPQQTPQTTAMSTLQQQHTQQKTVQENEQFTLAWLRASYEPLPPNDNTGCDANEIYRQYVSCCTKLSRKGVISPAHFPRLVRTVFGGTIGPNNVSLPNGETQQVYVGIRARNPQNRTIAPTGPASPILKAQLTNKVSSVETKPAIPSSPIPQSSFAQSLEGGNNTSLIKHLLAHKVSHIPGTQVAQRQQNQQKAIAPQSSVVTSNQSGIDLDPEALIKCTTIIPGGVASTITPVEEIVPKEEPVQIQIDEQSQLTVKAPQNKMLADLLEKKSNPPVQVVQMSSQLNAPTIQITETGQIVQVKPDPNPVLQINADSGQIITQTGQIMTQPTQIMTQSGQMLTQSGQIMTQTGQLLSQSGPFFQVKNEHGQIIQLKNEQGQIIHLKEPKIENIKQENESIVETVVTDHSYTEPPKKKLKVEEKREESVSKTAANLYAALAASALEDEEDLVQQPPMQIQQSTMQIQQPNMQVQQPTLQVQQPTLVQQVPQQTLQVQQPMLQVQPMDVQNIIATQSGQLILQDKTIATQPTQYVQQPMQIIAAPGGSQGGISYLAQNLPGNMMQKTIIIVQGATGGGPITLTVNNPGGLDEATLNSVIAQATEAITQQQIIQNSGVIQSGQRVIVSQPTLVSTSQPMTVVKTQLSQNAPQLTASQQPIITSQPQANKAQLITQNPQQIMVTQKQPPLLTSTNQSVITSNQQVITGNQQVITCNQQVMTGNQQIIAVSSNQQIIMNAPLKAGVHRVLQSPRTHIVSQASTETKTSVIQSAGTAPKPLMRQIITRQPIMMGGQKIGEKEIITNQPITEVQQVVPPKPVAKTPILPKPTPVAPTPIPTPTPVVQPTPTPAPQEDTPWICHWRGCGKVFDGANGVFTHAAKVHCSVNEKEESPCLWLDCDRVPRKTFALLNHLNDRHCTAAALKEVYNSRRHLNTDADANKPVALGYPPNAALAALNKHAAEFLNPKELMDENEGPVTKSIRLTAALILRNLVIYSNTGRRYLRIYESHLATIAMSNVEASRTISQVLYDLNNI